MDYFKKAIIENVQWVEKAYLAVPTSDSATAQFYMRSADATFKRYETYMDTGLVRHLHLLQEAARKSIQEKTAGA